MLQENLFSFVSRTYDSLPKVGLYSSLITSIIIYKKLLQSYPESNPEIAFGTIDTYKAGFADRFLLRNKTVVPVFWHWVVLTMNEKRIILDMTMILLSKEFEINLCKLKYHPNEPGLDIPLDLTEKELLRTENQKIIFLDRNVNELQIIVDMNKYRNYIKTLL